MHNGYIHYTIVHIHILYYNTTSAEKKTKLILIKGATIYEKKSLLTPNQDDCITLLLFAYDLFLTPVYYLRGNKYYYKYYAISITRDIDENYKQYL